MQVKNALYYEQFSNILLKVEQANIALVPDAILVLSISYFPTFLSEVKSPLTVFFSCLKTL